MQVVPAQRLTADYTGDSLAIYRALRFLNPSPYLFLVHGYTLDDHKRIAENVQAQLKKNLNLSLEINNEEWKVYLGTLKSNTPHSSSSLISKRIEQ